MVVRRQEESGGGVDSQQHYNGTQGRQRQNQNERDTRGSETKGVRQGEGGMCGDFGDLALEPSMTPEPSLVLERLRGQMKENSTHVDSRECTLVNDPCRRSPFASLSRYMYYITHVNRHPLKGCVWYVYIAIRVSIYHTEVVT